MWIIPKNLDVSACVRDTLDLNWESSELSLFLELSVMWRSKPSSARTWLRRLRRVSWMQLLYGRTLRPLMAGHFVRGYTSSLPVIPARERALPARGSKKETLDGFGRILKESLRQLDLFGASSRTSQDTLAVDTPQFIEAYAIWVTKSRLDCLRRRRSARLTREKECMSWPGPSVMDAAGFCGKPDKGRTGPNSGRTLTGKALEMEGKGPHAKWPTPNIPNRGKELSKKHRSGSGGIDLQSSVGQPAPDSPSTNGKSRELWTTPTTDDQNARKGKYKQGGMALNTQAKMWRTPSSDGEGGKMEIRSGCNTRLKLRDQTKGRLNPDWVEQLMGLPVGWTDLDSWEMV